MIKRALALLASLALLTALSLSARGAGGIRLVLSQAEGRVGEEVSLTLSARENPGIVGLQLQLHYDDTKLRLISVADGGILGDQIHHQEKMTSPYTLSWENYVAERNFVEDGVLCTLTFRILAGEEGEQIPVTLSCGDYGVMNYSLADLPRTLTDGGVTVTGGTRIGFVLPWVAAGVCILTPICFVVSTRFQQKKDPEKARKKA